MCVTLQCVPALPGYRSPRVERVFIQQIVRRILFIVARARVCAQTAIIPLCSARARARTEICACASIGRALNFTETIHRRQCRLSVGRTLCKVHWTFYYPLRGKNISRLDTAGN